MATSKKITELDQLTTAANADLLYIVHDPANIPTSKKITVSDLLKNTNSAISSAAATTYSNAVAYANGIAVAAYNNATDYTDSVANLLYTNVISHANSLAANAYSNALAYFLANPGSVSLQEKYYDYIPGNINGSGGLDNQFSGLSEDDYQHEIALPFPITFLGQTYNSIWIHSNSYLAFGPINGGDGSPYYPLGPQQVGVPAIMIGATDRQMTAYYYGTNGTKFIIRYEGIDKNWGGDGAAPSRIWEMEVDSESPDVIKISVQGYNIQPSTGIWGTHDGTKWTDIFEPLPFTDQNTDTTYYGVQLTSGAMPVTVNNFKFVGTGIDTYVVNSTAYVEIDPLHGILNVDLNDDSDTVLGSGYYGMHIVTAHDGNLRLSPAGDLYANAGSASSGMPGNGKSVYIKAGSAYSNGAQSFEGGSVIIGAGEGSNGGSNGVIQVNNPIVPSIDSINHAGTGTVLVLGNNQYQSIITGPAPNSTYMTAQRMVVQGQQGYDTGEGGDIYLWAGHSGANGGSGGDIKVDAGYGYNSSEGGTIKIRGGTSYGGTGGFVEIWSGQGTYGANILFSTWNSEISGWNQWALQSNGSIRFPNGTEQTTAFTGNKAITLVNTVAYSASSTEEILLCDPNAAGNNITVTLPNTAPNGKVYTVKNINDGGYDVYVEANGQPNIIELHGVGTFNTYDNISLSGNVVSWVYYDGYYRVISSS